MSTPGFVQIPIAVRLPPPMRRQDDPPKWTQDLLRDLQTMYTGIRQEIEGTATLHYVRQTNAQLFPAATETQAFTWTVQQHASLVYQWLMAWDIPSPPTGNQTCTLRVRQDNPTTGTIIAAVTFRMDREPQSVGLQVKQHAGLLASPQSMFVTVEPTTAVTMALASQYSYLLRADFA